MKSRPFSTMLTTLSQTNGGLLWVTTISGGHSHASPPPSSTQTPWFATWCSWGLSWTPLYSWLHGVPVRTTGIPRDRLQWGAGTRASAGRSPWTKSPWNPWDSAGKTGGVITHAKVASDDYQVAFVWQCRFYQIWMIWMFLFERGMKHSQEFWTVRSPFLTLNY